MEECARQILFLKIIKRESEPIILQLQRLNYLPTLNFIMRSEMGLPATNTILPCIDIVRERERERETLKYITSWLSFASKSNAERKLKPSRSSRRMQSTCSTLLLPYRVLDSFLCLCICGYGRLVSFSYGIPISLFT